MTIAVDHQVIIDKVYVYPTLQDKTNVIGRVNWRIEFSSGEFKSYGGGETMLSTDDLSNFVPIDQLTTQQIIDKVIAQEGGQAFIDQLKEWHTVMLERQVASAQMIEYELPTP